MHFPVELACLGLTASSGDLVVFSILLDLSIGRLGGLEDATYGTATTLPWGINSGDGIARRPTNLYEILFLGAPALLLWLLDRRTYLADDRRFQLFLNGYLLFRLLMEFIKPTAARPGLGLTAIGWACVAGLAYYVWG